MGVIFLLLSIDLVSLGYGGNVFLAFINQMATFLSGLLWHTGVGHVPGDGDETLVVGGQLGLQLK